MASLESLKKTLREKIYGATSTSKQALSDSQYSVGFDLLTKGSGWTSYQDFIIPQLAQLLTPLFDSRICVSVLEIGPGPKSVLGHLPDSLRHKVRTYTALEPNAIYAAQLEGWLRPSPRADSPLPCLEGLPNIQRTPFSLDRSVEIGAGDTNHSVEAFDVVLFCHSMYGMKPQHKFIEQALTMLSPRTEGGLVIVFHRDGALDLDGMPSCRTACFPAGVVCVPDDDNTLDRFTSFIAGFSMRDASADKSVKAEWRKVCRDLARREESHPDHLSFSAPEVMAAFTRHATMLPELTALVPTASAATTRVKNREARLHRAASIVRPEEIRHVQQCVRWALEHKVSLTVIGGGHSGHCVWPNVVSVDMSAFDRLHIVPGGDEEEIMSGSDPESCIVVEAGCKSGDIVRQTMAAGLAVPLGARPSVGAGLWLQGGIGHLARGHGLTCDTIVGAVMVSVASGEVICVGHVPSQHQPHGAVRPDNEDDILWAIKGAGTNFGIVISVTFKATAAPVYTVRSWTVLLSDSFEARLTLSSLDEHVASKLPRNASVDLYLYWERDALRIGVTLFQSSTDGLATDTPALSQSSLETILGQEGSVRTVDGVGLFETELYISGMHGGHGSGKTSSFKRCVLLKRIGTPDVAHVLIAAIENRPSPLCYLHLLQGGGAVADVATDATAFGCRDWDFACVITGVWPREKEGTEAAHAAVRWVYGVVGDLLPVGSGAYGADLGPDPRDAVLAATAFGPNRPRLARLKRTLDPGNVLAYACPLPKALMEPKLIILVTGETCAGKDYCAGIWVSVFRRSFSDLVARTVGISDAIKAEYATATGADLQRLLCDRAYKEQHRAGLSVYFQNQVRQQPQLPTEHFLSVVYGAAGVDVLFITGMRDEAPVAALSHLVPDSRLLEVRITASIETRRVRGGRPGVDVSHGESNDRPSLTFSNDTSGDGPAKRFCERNLLPFLHSGLQQLAGMVRPVPDFPRTGIEFRHVLNIAQQLGGLALCTSLVQSHFAADWARVDSVVCCETGGFVFAAALAAQVRVPLALIREAGKLPPPAISAVQCSSHISSSTRKDSRERRIEMARDLVPKGSSVVVVDDVLATGNTLCAVLRLLSEAGIRGEHINVMVVAEFPVHRGRELLRRHGFGQVNVQSLLIFGGA